MANKKFCIKNIQISNLFGYRTINWDLFEDVNILGSNNGGGKSTIFKIVYSILETGFLDSRLNELIDSITIVFYSDHCLFWKKEKIDRDKYIREEGYEYKVNLEDIDETGKLVIQKLQIKNSDNTIIKFDSIKDLIKPIILYTLEQEMITKDIADKIGNSLLKTNLDLLLYQEITERNVILARIIEKIDSYKSNPNELLQINTSNFLEENGNWSNIIKSIASKSPLELKIIKTKITEIKESSENKIKKLSDVFEESDLSDSINKIIADYTNEIAKSLSEFTNNITHQVNDIYKLLNDYYTDTSKKSLETNNFDFLCRNKKTISYLQLSGGEKQLLLLFLKAFNTENKECIFLLDEPDLGMHIDWKEKLIKTLRNINPKMQLIVATHAPSMIEGWINNVIEISQISTDKE